MAKKIKNDYFKLMEDQSACCVEAAKLLTEILENFSMDSLTAQKNRMHDIEHRADAILRDIEIKLSTEFITPIDQEDLLRLAHVLEEVSDALDEAVQDIYMHHVNVAPKGALKLAQNVENCVVTLHEAVGKLREFKKPDALRALLEKVGEIETETDIIYGETIRELFTEETDARILIGHKAVCRSIEDCCDFCDHAADTMEQIIIKNT